MVDLLDHKMPDQEFTEELRSVGWAPGWYCQKCSTCGDAHIADKRAIVCLDCANEQLEQTK
jgi:hypothetical protein